MMSTISRILSPKTTIAVLMAAMLLMLPISSSAATGFAVPFTGTAVLPGTTTPVPIAGTFNITSFANQNGQLVAKGTLNFALAGAQKIIQATAAVTDAGGDCTILNLTLGPIHLDLLGLVIDTNAIHLQITAQQGPGNLLGNLLCAVANLLNGGLGGLTNGLLNQLATLLNQLLAQL